MKKATATDVGLLIMRVAIALVMMFSGSQKAFGLFGGMGPQGFITTLKNSHGFPAWLSTLAIIAEVGGGVGLLLGFLTRLSAFGVLCTMSVALWVLTKDGFDWVKVQLAVVMALMALGFLVAGSGRLGIDPLLFKRKRR